VPKSPRTRFNLVSESSSTSPFVCVRFGRRLNPLFFLYFPNIPLISRILLGLLYLSSLSIGRLLVPYIPPIFPRTKQLLLSSISSRVDVGYLYLSA
jgi:hypothetical protein